jgi:hypothetical protein
MAKSIINLGTTANDGTGDNLRVGGDKINDNFDEIYAKFGDGSTLNKAVVSDNAGITGADKITNIVSLTQAEYNALATKNATTLYVIVG